MTDRAPAPADVEAIAEVMCHEYHPMHWDVAYGNRTKPCQACKIHAAALLASPALATLRAHWTADALQSAADDAEKDINAALLTMWLRDRAEEVLAAEYDRARGYTRREGVGTGAGEGATGQDTGTAWVTRSTDCPEAPAQAHPLVATDDAIVMTSDELATLRAHERANGRREERARKRCGCAWCCATTPPDHRGEMHKKTCRADRQEPQ